ncbi:hypothetical protein O6H91_09G045000 [Diphasiastrum complanatum]|uniref:Uncharacterized protein n=2 Tax=Diphasiastrum complanatum TaxID=34168 RepID=A0ACC2CNL1_DIPCM|nr:hypothetical protein O6H91_09G045000 [Diphasiastrum complanatum]KAJ7543614.1 hypothetical protein O6H91_09G045000 [Diphasiastrum complanatum]
MGSKNRPPPLRINKDSQQIKKPPLRLPILQHRQPVIIHTYSPKVIQTDPNNFMSLVQKLTGRGIETGYNVHTKDHFIMDSMALPSPHLSCASPRIHAAGRNLDQSNVGFLVSPRSPLPPITAEVVFNQGYDEPFSLTPGPLYLRSPASFTALASPRLWSSIPSPNILSQRFLADLPSLSPGMQGPMDNLLMPSPRLLSPQSRYGGILQSPGTLAYKDWACKYIGDYP